MIDRYKNKQIEKIWSLRYKFNFFQTIELRLIETLSGSSTIPLSRRTPDIENIKQLEQTTKHEVVAFLKDMENRLLYKEHKSLLHYGLTSSDLLDTTFSYQIRESLSIVSTELYKTLALLNEKMQENSDVIVLGRTHGRIAEQIPLSMRFEHLKDEILYCISFLSHKGLVGKLSGPVGVSHITKEQEKQILSTLDLNPATFTTQVIPRHHYAQIMSSMAILGACFERFAKNIRLLSIDEINEWSETKSIGQYGSSSMPHKTNPILSERICGLSRILRSHSNTAIENIALWLERDISHSSVERIIWPDSFHILVQIISDTNEILKKLFINKTNLLEKNKSFKAKFSSHEQMLNLQKQGKSRFEAYANTSKQKYIQAKN